MKKYNENKQDAAAHVVTLSRPFLFSSQIVEDRSSPRRQEQHSNPDISTVKELSPLTAE